MRPVVTTVTVMLVDQGQEIVLVPCLTFVTSLELATNGRSLTVPTDVTVMVTVTSVHPTPRSALVVILTLVMSLRLVTNGLRNTVFMDVMELASVTFVPRIPDVVPVAMSNFVLLRLTDTIGIHFIAPTVVVMATATNVSQDTLVALPITCKLAILPVFQIHGAIVSIVSMAVSIPIVTPASLALNDVQIITSRAVS